MLRRARNPQVKKKTICRSKNQIDGLTKKKIQRELIFFALLKEYDLPIPTKELKFHPSRRWRFDYSWDDVGLAVEQEGGIFTGGRHSRGQGMVNDMEKYNAAAELGWVVLRYTPQQIETQACVHQISKLYDLLMARKVLYDKLINKHL